jgi:hypothetical protein
MKLHDIKIPLCKGEFFGACFYDTTIKLYCIVSSVTNNIAYCNVINGGWKFALQMQDFKIIISEGYTEELMILVRNVPNFGEDYNLAIHKMNNFLTQANQLP